MTRPTRPMQPGALLSAFVCAGLLTTLGPAPARAGDDWDRLRQIPREQRVLLDKKLREFDVLDRSEQSSIRALDEALASLPEGDRAIQYAVMRRYHLWVQTLTEAQKTELNAAPITKRLKVAEKLRAEQRANHSPKPIFFQLADFGTASPYELATRIKVWLKLSSADKAAVSKLEEEPRKRRMTEWAKTLKIAPVAEPVISDERKNAILDRVSKKAPMLEALLKRGEDEKKKAVRTRQVIETYYLLDHPPDKVSAEALLKFDAALPPWIRNSFDTLSPDEARRRLSILYRLIFPSPLEMDTPKPAASKTAPKGIESIPSKGQGVPSKGVVPAPGKGAASKSTGPY